MPSDTGELIMSLRIVFINQSTGYLTIDVINQFTPHYDKVALIAGSVRVQDVPLDEKVGVSYILKYNRGNALKKTITWLFGTMQIAFLLLTRYRSFEVVFITIPPTAYLFAPLLKRKYSIIIYDLYPDSLTAFGLNSSSLLSRWWSRKNRKIFTAAHRVYTLSDSMKDAVLNYAPNCNVHVIPNWSAFSGMKPIAKKENRFLKEGDMADKFIVQYSGNIGFAHHVESIVNLAEELKEDGDLFFMIIGRGKRIDEINEMIEQKGLSNIVLIPFRKDEDLFESLCSADLAVVTLDDKSPNISVPSKTYNILAAGKPLMVIASEESEIARLVKKHQNGRTFLSSDYQGMRSFIMELKNNPETYVRLSELSLQASKEYSSRNAARYLDIYNS